MRTSTLDRFTCMMPATLASRSHGVAIANFDISWLDEDRRVLKRLEEMRKKTENHYSNTNC